MRLIGEPPLGKANQSSPGGEWHSERGGHVAPAAPAPCTVVQGWEHWRTAVPDDDVLVTSGGARGQFGFRYNRNLQ